MFLLSLDKDKGFLETMDLRQGVKLGLVVYYFFGGCG